MDITSDLMFVNKIQFLVTLGQRVKFTTIESLINYPALTLLKGIQSFISLYNEQKYSIYTMFVENYFEVQEAYLNKIQVTLNTTVAREGVTEIGR